VCSVDLRAPDCTSHCHTLSDNWPDNAYDKFVHLHDPRAENRDRFKVGAFVCDEHFLEHDYTNFTKNQFPGLRTDFQGPHYMTTSTRTSASGKRKSSGPDRDAHDDDDDDDDDSYLDNLSPSSLLKEARRFRRERNELRAERDRLAAEVGELRQRRFVDNTALCVSINDKTRELWCGLNTAEFNVLHDEWHLYVDKGGSNRAKFTKKSKIEALLCFLSLGLSLEQLASMLNVHGSTAAEWIWNTIDDLIPWVEKQIYLPSVKDWIANSKKTLASPLYDKKLFFFVDGTVLKIPVPMDNAVHRATRNTKHNCHAWSIFILVDSRGVCVPLDGFVCSLNVVK
jgi:hypothetical protein